MLTLKKNTCLLKDGNDRGDLKSAQKLITSHLSLVAKLQWDIEVMGYQ